VIIATNKSPTEWAKTLDDTVLTIALLDRLLYRGEVIKLQGSSYQYRTETIYFKQLIIRSGI